MRPADYTTTTTTSVFRSSSRHPSLVGRYASFKYRICSTLKQPPIRVDFDVRPQAVTECNRQNLWLHDIHCLSCWCVWRQSPTGGGPAFYRSGDISVILKRRSTAVDRWHNVWKLFWQPQFDEYDDIHLQWVYNCLTIEAVGKTVCGRVWLDVFVTHSPRHMTLMIQAIARQVRISSEGKTNEKRKTNRRTSPLRKTALLWQLLNKEN